MSYALRNSLILVLIFLLMAGAGYSYLQFIQKAEIEVLQAELDEKQAIYSEMSAIAETFPILESAISRSEDFFASYNKTLFPGNDPDQIYRFLTEINTEWPRVEFNFIFNDSTLVDQYGIVQSSVSGTGSYRAVYNFVNRIENSRPVQKVNDLQVSPMNTVGEYGNANFSFVLRSYYDRLPDMALTGEDLQAAYRNPNQFHNPFYPLIRDIEPNEDNLTNVESSRLVGISSSRIFIRNQDGQLVNLSVGSQVYLGTLQQIDVQARQAIFRLNKGGIIEEFTLEASQ